MSASNRRAASRVIVIATIIVAVFTAAGVNIDAQSKRKAAPPPPPACDRDCLTSTVDAYLTALVAHDPKQAPLARTVRFTENTGMLDVGEGLWIGASEEPTTFKIYVPDPIAHQIGFLGVLKEFDKPVLLALRLRVENKQITEIEHIVSRSLIDVDLKNLVTPRPGLTDDVMPGERTSRSKMLAIANTYYDSILKSSGSVAPYADDCERHENGMIASGSRQRSSTPTISATSSANAMQRIRALPCAAAIDTHYLSYITGIDLRRVTIADEQRGLVFALTMFRHRGEARTITILNVPGIDTLPMNFGPIDLQAAHVFKISGGRIHEIEAMGYTLPYKSRTGW